VTLRKLHAAVAVCVLVASTGCPDPVETCSDGPCWLELQSWVSIDESGTAGGFLRWLYVSTDPTAEVVAEPDCEVWERLALDPVPVDEACGGCTHQFAGTAALDIDDSTCSVSRDPWTFVYAFAPLDGNEALESWGREGYTHEVQTRWSPDLGETQGFQSLFVATPEAWDEGPAGASDEPRGEYALESLHYWDLR